MKLFELLSVDRIVLDMPGETVRDAARPLVHAVITSGRALDPERLEALLADALPGEAVTVGQQAPDFSLTYLARTSDGKYERKTVSPGSFKGQKSGILAFFPAAFSPG